MAYQFIPGMELNRKFYYEVVGPLLKKHFPKLKYAAALTGNGSDVLGFDDPTSMDHNWGPKMRIILPERNFEKIKKSLDQMLRQNLPYSFMGFPTNFSKEHQGYLKQSMMPINSGPVNHLIRFYTIKSFFKHYLGFDPKHKITVADWLTFPEQALLEITSGEVFHDTVGFSKEQNKFAFYPKDIWRYIMYVQWGRVGDELQHHARSGKNGDELGSRVLAARMTRRIMKLAFLIEEKYAPYAKWFGMAFNQLQVAIKLGPLLMAMLREDDWKKRQAAITAAHVLLAKTHNQRKITKFAPLQTHDFHGRGYKVFEVEPIMEELYRSIHNTQIKNLRYQIGAIDQFIDHARINHEHYIYRKLRFLFKN